jgi:5-oxoprolinase (ATP-hydrolysing)
LSSRKVYKVEDLEPGHEIPGPGIIVQPISTVVLEVNCTAYVTANGDLNIKIIQAEDADHSDDPSTVIKADPVKLSIFSHRFMGIAEQM